MSPILADRPADASPKFLETPLQSFWRRLSEVSAQNNDCSARMSFCNICCYGSDDRNIIGEELFNLATFDIQRRKHASARDWDGILLSQKIQLELHKNFFVERDSEKRVQKRSLSVRVYSSSETVRQTCVPKSDWDSKKDQICRQVCVSSEIWGGYD